MSKITKAIAKKLYPGKAIIHSGKNVVEVDTSVFKEEKRYVSFRPMVDDSVGRSQLMKLTMDLLMEGKGKLNLKPELKSHEGYARMICEAWLSLKGSEANEQAA